MTTLLSLRLRDITNQDRKLSPAHSKSCEVTEPCHGSASIFPPTVRALSSIYLLWHQHPGFWNSEHTPKHVPRPHPVCASWRTIIGSLSKEVGFPLQPKLSSASSQVLVRNWRDKTVHSACPQRINLSLGGRILIHTGWKKPDAFLCMSFPTVLGGVGGSNSSACLACNTPKAGGHANPRSRNVFQLTSTAAKSESPKSSGSCRKPGFLHHPRINQKLLIARS